MFTISHFRIQYTLMLKIEVNICNNVWEQSPPAATIHIKRNRWWSYQNPLQNKINDDVELKNSGRADFRDQSEELPTIAGYKINTNAGNGLELPQLDHDSVFFSSSKRPFHLAIFFYFLNNHYYYYYIIPRRRCLVNTAMPNSAPIQGCLVRFNNSW